MSDRVGIVLVVVFWLTLAGAVEWFDIGGPIDGQGHGLAAGWQSRHPPGARGAPLE